MKILLFKYFFAIFFLWINNGIPNTNAQFPTYSSKLEFDNTATEFIERETSVDNSSAIYSSEDDITNLSTEETSDPDPKLRNFNARIERNVRDELFLDCTDVGTDNIANEITWIKDDVFLTDFDSNNRMEQREWSLRILNIQMGDAGEYTCAMENDLGSFNFTFEVLVYDPPEMIIKPENITLKVGESGSFRCKSSSKIPSFIEWYPGVNLNEVSSMADLTQEQYVNVKMNEDNPEIFEVQNVALTDQGWYSCLARNGLNTVNASAYLEVIEDDHGIMKIIKGIIIFVMIPLVTILVFRKKRRILVFLVRKFYL